MTVDETPPGELPTAPPKELPSGSPVDALEAALGVIPPKQQLPLPRWLGWLTLSVVIGFIPWIVYLSLTLPGDQRTNDYDIAWVGYDSAMALVLTVLAYCALRRKTATGPVAAVAATMLLVDAWFDIVTTEGGDDLLLAVLFAAFAELPLAIICGWIAVNAELVRARAYRRLRLRWERAVEIARAAQKTAHPVDD
ncbi:MAG TPA: hypothetical protein VJ831_15490 [Jatrophihabitantaceae bacterium]|nr:hypothetical protein [Jatrophihabitantaceae bacterium]